MNLFMKASSAVNLQEELKKNFLLTVNLLLNHPLKAGQRSTDKTLFQLIKMMILMRMGSRCRTMIDGIEMNVRRKSMKLFRWK